MIKNLQESLLTEILPNLTLNTAYRPYIECPPNRGDTARCSPRYFFDLQPGHDMLSFAEIVIFSSSWAYKHQIGTNNLLTDLDI